MHGSLLAGFFTDNKFCCSPSMTLHSSSQHLHICSHNTISHFRVVEIRFKLVTLVTATLIFQTPTFTVCTQLHFFQFCTLHSFTQPSIFHDYTKPTRWRPFSVCRLRWLCTRFLRLTVSSSQLSPCFLHTRRWYSVFVLEATLPLLASSF